MDSFKAGAGVDSYAGYKPRIYNLLQGCGWMILSLWMNIDGIPRPQSINENLNSIIGVLNHQMDIKRLIGQRTYTSQVIQRHGIVRYISPIHDIYMEGIYPSCLQCLYFFAQVAVIRTHHGGH